MNLHTTFLPLTDKRVRMSYLENRGLARGLDLNTAERGHSGLGDSACTGREICPIAYVPRDLWVKYRGWRTDKSERTQFYIILKHQPH